MSSFIDDERQEAKVNGDASQHASSSSQPLAGPSSSTAPSTPILRPPPSPTNHRRHRSGSNVSASSSTSGGANRRISLSHSSSSRNVPRRSIAHGPAALGESYDSGRSLLFDADASGAGAAQWDDVNLDTVDDAGTPAKGRSRGGSLFRNWSGLARGTSIQEERLNEEEESIAMRGYDTGKRRQQQQQQQQQGEATMPSPLPPPPRNDGTLPGRRESQALAWHDGGKEDDGDDEAILFAPPGETDDDEQRQHLPNGHTPPSTHTRLPPSSHIYNDYDDDEFDDDEGDEEDALRSGGSGARSSSKSLRFEPLTRPEKISYAATTVIVVALSIVAVAIGVDWIDWPGDGIGRD